MTTGSLRIFLPVAIRGLMTRLGPRLDTAAGAAVAQTVDLNPRIPERINAGEAFDIGLTNPEYVPALIDRGRVDAATHRPFGRVPLAVGRRSGPETQVLRDAPAISELFRKAESIAYTGAGTSGRMFLNAVARLGLPETVASKSRPMGGGEPVASVAAGETELAVAPLTTILSTPGISPAAVFPSGFGTDIDMSVFLAMSPGSGAAAVLDLLTTSVLDEELAAAGIQRFRLE
ncbi:ABC transporter substrate-binding protein [Ruegeria marina]|uniref:Molybdate transport system substrate-binding protein n=1 Tax=Ruegeria marina TaxID=639004 RepID=A0A1G6WTV9_9RHOB|nr:ABC transporter substrate-binding protein [Ruegeria marina]SDD68465.1 hypothetical protein SAMN04488239_109147 [Ruegeria marina]